MIVTRKKKEVLMIQVITEEVREILTALKADEEIDNLEEAVAIIEEIAEVFRLRNMKNKNVQQSHASSRNLDQVGVWWHAMIIPFRTP